MEDPGGFTPRKELFHTPSRWVPIKSSNEILIVNNEKGNVSTKPLTQVPLEVFNDTNIMHANGKYYEVKAQYAEGKRPGKDNIVELTAHEITSPEKIEAVKLQANRVDNLVLEKYSREE